MTFSKKRQKAFKSNLNRINKMKKLKQNRKTTH